MRKSAFFIIIIGLLNSIESSVMAQQEINWESYIIQKEKGPMAITVNMDLNFARPNYKHLLLVGINTNKCQDNGYPNEEGLEKLYAVSDSVASIIEKKTKNRLAGIITYQCTGFDVFYLKDTLGIRSELDSFFKRQYPSSKKYVDITFDKRWEYYKSSLFPKNLDDDFFINHIYLNQLVINGENLDIPKKVRHWIYFKRDKRRQGFIRKIKALKFKIVSQKFIKGRDLPYELELERIDYIDPESIAVLTKMLNSLSKSSFGLYDGWGVEPEVEN